MSLKGLKVAVLSIVVLINAVAVVNAAETQKKISKDFFVSPTGSDENPGTIAKPFATITKARDAVRSSASAMTGDIIVYLREGSYFVDKPIELNEQDKGRNGFYVVYKNFQQEKPVIYGGTKIATWEKWKDAIYRTKIDPKEPIYAMTENGIRGICARYPDDGFLRTDSAVRENRTAKLCFKKDDLPTFNFKDAQLFCWPGNSAMDWFSSTNPIQNVDFSNRIITLAIPVPGKQYSISADTRYFVQGSRDFLSRPGEFYCDESEGFFYYWPIKSPIEKQLIVIARTPSILTFKGTSPQSLVENVKIQGLEFNLSNAIKHIPFFDSASFATNAEAMVTRTGMLFLENARNITIADCRILNAGLHAVMLSHYAQNNEIRGNWIESAGFNGVNLSGWPPNEGSYTNITDAYVNKNNIVSNNFIYNCGRVVGHGSGIQFYNSGNNEIAHNRITKMPRYGISLKGTPYSWKIPQYNTIYGEPNNEENHHLLNFCQNNKISYNDISDVMRESGDGGATEAFGTGGGNVFYGNCAHNFYYYRDLIGHLFYGYMSDDDAPYSTYENNLIYNYDGTDAIYRGQSAFISIFKNNYWLDSRKQAQEFSSKLGIAWDSIGLTADFSFKAPAENEVERLLTVKHKNGDSLILNAYQWNCRKDLWTMSTFTRFIAGSAETDGESWAGFLNVDFGKGYSKLIVNAASERDTTPNLMEVHLDSARGDLIGTLQVVKTGSSGLWDVFTDQKVVLTKTPKGVHNVYIVFKQPGVGNFRRFTFSGQIK